MNICAKHWFLLGCSSVLLLYSPISAKADTEGPYTYTIADGTATITDFSSNYVGILTITNELGGYPVANIGTAAFSYCNKLTSVTILNGIVSIGDQAFSFCTSMVSLAISDSVTNIDKSAFFYCPSMTNVVIPHGVTRIGDFAFHGCAGLTTVTLPGSLTSIGAGVFGSCSSLTNISVELANVTFSSEGGVLFDKIETVLIQYPGGKAGAYDIPGSVTNIATYAFSSCSLLSRVTIPDSVASIGYGAFMFCSALTNATIGNYVASIGTSAFGYCSGLTSLMLPDSVTSIGSYAFEHCSTLTNVTIGNGVTSIVALAFSYCSSLTSVVIPDSVTSIGDDVFFSCSALTSATVGNSVTSLGFGVFRQCGDLQRVYFTGDAPNLNGGVFTGSEWVTVYYLPDTANWGSPFSERTALLWNPVFTSVSIAGGTNFCSVTGTPSIPVSLEANINLLSGQWVHLVTTNITDGAVILLDTNAMNNPKQYYRVIGP